LAEVEDLGIGGNFKDTPTGFDFRLFRATQCLESDRDAVPALSGLLPIRRRLPDLTLNVSPQQRANESSVSLKVVDCKYLDGRPSRFYCQIKMGSSGTIGATRVGFGKELDSRIRNQKVCNATIQANGDVWGHPDNRLLYIRQSPKVNGNLAPNVPSLEKPHALQGMASKVERPYAC